MTHSSPSNQDAPCQPIRTRSTVLLEARGGPCCESGVAHGKRWIWDGRRVQVLLDRLLLLKPGRGLIWPNGYRFRALPRPDLSVRLTLHATATNIETGVQRKKSHKSKRERRKGGKEGRVSVCRQNKRSILIRERKRNIVVCVMMMMMMIMMMKGSLMPGRQGTTAQLAIQKQIGL